MTQEVQSKPVQKSPERNAAIDSDEAAVEIYLNRPLSSVLGEVLRDGAKGVLGFAQRTISSRILGRLPD